MEPRFDTRPPPPNTDAGLDFASLVELDFGDIKWAKENVLPEGFCILGGTIKIGKSAFMEWLACEIGQTMPVAYFALEYNQRTLSERLKKQQSHGLSPVHAKFWDQYQVQDSSESPIEFVRTRVEEMQPYLVVVDTLARIKPETRGGYQEEYAATMLLKEIADDTKTNLVAIHHTRKTNKDGETDPREELLGSQGIGAAADNLLVYDRPDGTTRVRGFGRLIDDYETYLDYDSGLYRVIDKQEIADQVLKNQFPSGHKVAAVLQNGPASIKEMEMQINRGLSERDPERMTQNQIWNTCDNFREKGLAKSSKRRGGLWHWTGA